MRYFHRFVKIESTFSWSICLLVAATVAASYGDVNQGLRLEAEAPIQYTQCPSYDDPNHIVMFSYPDDCRKYYSCLNGLAYAHQCPDNYYWSQLTYRCDFKEYSNCGNAIDPATPIIPPDQYKAYPGDCTRYYVTRALSCADGYHWNARTERCDLPQFAGCASSWNVNPSSFAPTAATPPAVFPTTVQPGHSLPIAPVYLCENAAHMKYLPYPGDCHKFIHCGPTVNVLYCPVGLYWNRNTQSCDLSTAACQ